MDKNSSSPAPSFWVVYNLSAWFHRLADFPPGGILCDCEYVKPAPPGLGCGERTVSPHLKPGQGRRETLLLSWPGQSLGPAQCRGEWGAESLCSGKRPELADKSRVPGVEKALWRSEQAVV